MSAAGWMSASEAQFRAHCAGISTDDLIEWARRDKLRVRAKGRIDSEDVSLPALLVDCLITHPKEPPADEDTRDALGPWPDVPAFYWNEPLFKAEWLTGTFLVKVSYFCDFYQEPTYSSVELRGVTFHAGDFLALIS